MKMKRGVYGELEEASIPKYARAEISAIKKALAKTVPGWKNIGDSEFDRKGRGYALNIDVYGYGRDAQNSKLLAVVQVRFWEIRTAKQQYPRIRKDYYLIGRNEDSSVFAHPVGAHAVRAAARTGRDVIRAAQAWMFGVDYDKLCGHRQGDVALRPCLVPKGAVEQEAVFVPDRHTIAAKKYYTHKGRSYVTNPVMTHPQHPTIPWWVEGNIYPDDHTYELIIARKEPTWDYTNPTVD